MIVPMKKLSVVSLDKDKVPVLEALGRLGTVHIHQENPQSPDLSKATEEVAKIESALSFLPKVKEGDKPYSAGPQELMSDIFTLQTRKSEAEEQRLNLSRAMEDLTPWGDFASNDLEYLREKGFFPKLYKASGENQKNLAAALPGKVTIVSDKDSERFMVVHTQDIVLEGFEHFPWPALGLSETTTQLGLIEKDLQALESRFQQLAVHRGTLERFYDQQKNQVSWESALASLETEGKVAFFTGFAPNENLEEIKVLSGAMGFGLGVSDPEADDPVPTLVKTPRWLEMIKPVFGFLGIVPGYKELDISFFFLIFFMIFFAMIIGDAGYGMIILAGGLGLAFNGLSKGKKLPPMGLLLTLMGAGTVAWGAMTGSWFGSPAVLETIPFLKTLVIPALNAWSDASIQSVQLLCFVLGLSHLTIAQVWNILRELAGPYKLRALAQAGWVGINLGLFNMILNLVLDKTAYPILDVSLYGIMGGFILVVLFGSQEGKFFKGILAGIGGLLPTALGLVSGFGDIISYIRLFAVGLAGLEIAKSFNAMAAPLMDGPGLIGGILILFLGHALNFVLAALGVLVHGIRLNVLEFSGRLGLEWSGRAYTPFIVKNKESKTKE